MRRTAIPWIGLGLAAMPGLAAVYGPGISPRSAKTQALGAQIGATNDALRKVSENPVGTPDTAAVEAYRKEVAQRFLRSIEFYAAADRGFEGWGDEFPNLGPDSSPGVAEIMARYIDLGS